VQGRSRILNVAGTTGHRRRLEYYLCDLGLVRTHPSIGCTLLLSTTIRWSRGIVIASHLA